MSEDYEPPFVITPGILTQVAEIAEAVGSASGGMGVVDLRLRRISRIRTIQGSLAIEGNTLSEEQITAILEGRRVVASPREVREARNAIVAYDCLGHWLPHVEANLLEAHAVLMEELIPDAGAYRSGGVGVMAEHGLIHLAPPFRRVPALMGGLLAWLERTNYHPLVSSSIFHYEFEFIHPFSDGNGRMGRLWQTLVLTGWNPIFADIPVESMIHFNQDEYYAALRISTKENDSAPFVAFILKMIREALKKYITPQAAPQVTPQVQRLLQALSGEMSAGELRNALGLRDKKSFRTLYLVPALRAGMIELTIPEKPNSPKQRYRLSF